MGFRRRAAIAAWGRALVAEHTPAVADLMGLRPPLPRVRVHVGRLQNPAVTAGRRILLSEQWFAEHPDDAGAVVHELSHALLNLRAVPDGTLWLLEGVADLARNHVGLDTEWSAPHHEPGGATAGYQSTAHFLAWVEQQSPGTVAHLVGRVVAGRHDDAHFSLDGRPLADLVAAYDAAHA